MALKSDIRLSPYDDDISFFMDEVADKGYFAVISTGGSGAAMDQSNAVITLATTSSGKVPVGVLLQPMVNKDLTQTHLNFFNGEVQKGGKIRVNSTATVVTDAIYPGLTITAGDTAYLSTSGLLRNTNVSNQNPTVGVFLSSKDADGFAKVKIKL